jgi:hypothetical protein
MPRERSKGKKSFARSYHSLISLLLVLGGGALFGYGIYLRVSKYHGEAFLNFAKAANGSSNSLQIILQFDIAAIILGAIFFFVGIIALVALARSAVGRVSRLVTFVLMAAIVAGLAAIAVYSFFLYRYQHKASFQEHLKLMWQNQIKEDSNVICAIENDLSCRGFSNNDCVNCTLGTESTCSSAQRTVCAPCSSKDDHNAKGCIASFNSFFWKLYIVIGSVAIGLAVAGMIDMLTMCCL